MTTTPTRTPEGEPNHCFVCRRDVVIEPSTEPGRDAPCPYCGHLLWFPEPGFRIAKFHNFDIDAFVADLDSWIERSGPNVIIDFADVDFVGSIILGKLISLHRKLGAREGKLTVRNIEPLIREVFHITKLDTLFDVDDGAPE